MADISIIARAVVPKLFSHNKDLRRWSGLPCLEKNLPTNSRVIQPRQSLSPWCFKGSGFTTNRQRTGTACFCWLIKLNLFSLAQGVVQTDTLTFPDTRC